MSEGTPSRRDAEAQSGLGVPDPRDSPPALRGEVAFRLLVDAVRDYAIFLLGPDGRVLTWNRGAERIKGYTGDEIIGRHFSVFYTPEERAADRPMRILALAAEHGSYEDEGWRVRRDGTRFWADVIVTALYDESGTPYAYAKVTRDLTLRREAEDQRVQLVAEQRARVAAEEALAIRDRFLGIASHELKTPLATLQLATESLARAQASGRVSEERLAAAVDRVHRATSRLTALVSELLDVSRLSDDRARIDPVAFDLAGLVREVIERYAETDRRRAIAYDGPNTLPIVADPGRIDQVVSNLVDNAVKYSEADCRIEVALEAASDAATLTVTDSGIGLGDEVDPAIFDAFGRGTNAEALPGMGLGLYIAQQIVTNHGGRITAQGRAGGGAVFTVRLPYEPPAGAPST